MSAQARVAAVIDGQKRMLKGSVDSMQTLIAATRTAFGLGGGATFEFTVIHVSHCSKPAQTMRG